MRKVKYTIGGGLVGVFGTVIPLTALSMALDTNGKMILVPGNLCNLVKNRNIAYLIEIFFCFLGGAIWDYIVAIKWRRTFHGFLWLVAFLLILYFMLCISFTFDAFEIYMIVFVFIYILMYYIQA